MRRLAAFAFIALATLPTAGCIAVGTNGSTASPGIGASVGPAGHSAPPIDPGQAGQQLDALPVAPQLSMAGYSRDRFPHWIEQPGGCDTREMVLKRDGTDVQTTKTCRVTSGHWVSPYDGKTFTNPTTMDVDHLVPLADAWRSGARNWTDEKRKQFANDLTDPQLVAVSASANRAKGDQDPSQWKPANRGYWCTYAQNWIVVKRQWQLTVTEVEKTALKEMLGTC